MWGIVCCDRIQVAGCLVRFNISASVDFDKVWVIVLFLSLSLAFQVSEPMSTATCILQTIHTWTIHKRNRQTNASRITAKQQSTIYYNFHVLTTNQWPIQTKTRSINTGIFWWRVFTWLWRWLPLMSVTTNSLCTDYPHPDNHTK